MLDVETLDVLGIVQCDDYTRGTPYSSEVLPHPAAKSAHVAEPRSDEALVEGCHLRHARSYFAYRARDSALPSVTNADATRAFTF